MKEKYKRNKWSVSKEHRSSIQMKLQINATYIHTIDTNHQTRPVIRISDAK